LRWGPTPSAASPRSSARADSRYDVRVAPGSQLLAGVPLFRGLDEAALKIAAVDARVVRAASGRSFFREGDAAKFFFVLRRGRVKFTQISPEGHEVILRVIGPGEPFGGVAAIEDNGTYPVTVRALEASEAYAWDGAKITALMYRYPSIAVNAARMIARRLHDLQRRHQELMTDRVERRIARAILRLAEHSGRAVAAGVEIDFPLSRQDLAQMTGTTLFTVSRTLSGWEDAGIIVTARRRVTVARPRNLLRIAEDLPSP
jgi:CRP-like cAMP-binding protein